MNSTFSGNHTINSDAGGGAIYSFGYLTLTNATFSDNNTSGYASTGGAIKYVGDLTATNSTFSGNSTSGASSDGGAIYVRGDATLTNSILSGNIATDAGASGDELFRFVNPNNPTTTTYVGGKFIGMDIFDGATDVGDTIASSIFAATADNNGVDAGVLGDNGGPAQTIALLADAANPAPNTSDASQLVEATAGADLNGDGDQLDIIAADATGAAREQLSGLDLGAVEVTQFPEAASLIFTTISDVEDQFDGETSLREAIGFVNDGTLSGTITFANGVGEAFETGGEIDLTLGQLLITSGTTIDGDLDDDGTADLTVDAQGSSRVFDVSGAGTNVAFDGLVITGGYTNTRNDLPNPTQENGGGLRFGADTLGTLLNSQVTNNSAQESAGFFGFGGGHGGGVYVGENAIIGIDGSSITGNSTVGGSGGGLDVRKNADVTISVSVTSDNNSAGSGGGVQQGFALITIEDSRISDNMAYSTGGGIYNAIGTLTIRGTTLDGNTGINGGAISNSFGASSSIYNSTLSSNSANGSGGAVRNGGSLIFTNTTVSGNSSGNGSAIQSSVTFAAVNSTFTGNTGAGSSISSQNYGATTPGSIELTNTIVLVNDYSGASEVRTNGGSITLNGSNIIGGEANTINIADVFDQVALVNGVTSGVLADNGGSVQTVALLADPANAAVNTGDARVFGTTVYLGAAELQVTIGSNGPNVEIGDADDNAIATGTGSDAINAGEGNDSIDAGPGDDLVLGGAGQELIYGGNDDDVILPGAGADTVFGGDGDDTVSYVLSNPGVTVDLSNNSNNTGDAAGDVFNEIENIMGSADASNTLTGDGNANTIERGSANDTLNGGAGNDRLEGKGGTDTLDGGLGDDIIVIDSADDVTDQAADEGYDRVFASASVVLGDNVEAGNLTGTDDLTMTAAATGSWIQGNSGNNTLLGQGANDRLDGNAGDDTIDGGGGNDVQEGGSGADVFVLSDGVDSILDFENGTDLIDLTSKGIRFEDVTVVKSGSNVLLTHGTGSLTVRNFDLADLDDSDFIQPLVSTPPIVTGTSGYDNLTQNAGPLDIRGLGGNDVLRAFKGGVTLTGGEGDDRYFAYDDRTTIVELAD